MVWSFLAPAVRKTEEIHIFLHNCSDFFLEKLMEALAIVLVYPFTLRTALSGDEIVALGTTCWRAQPDLSIWRLTIYHVSSVLLAQFDCKNAILEKQKE